MNRRIDYHEAPGAAVDAMVRLEQSVARLGIDSRLLELVRLRVSQVNGCAYCVDAHSIEAMIVGESDRRLHALAAWRDTPFFTPRERAALAWSESLTRVADTHAPDEDYALLREHLSDKDMVDLTVAIIAANGWNRLAIGFRRRPHN